MNLFHNISGWGFAFIARVAIVESVHEIYKNGGVCSHTPQFCSPVKYNLAWDNCTLPISV